ncbi:thiamine-binding protein, partial [Halorientalis sp.]|uniref:thiamine-binding protein n=1 Tax=Halorientalis sp. TaxID=1931229 RepID=UPI0026317889
VAALEGYDVAYETTPMGTIIEAEDATEVFAAAQAAHEAVDADRVSTFLKVKYPAHGGAGRPCLILHC